MLLPLIGVFIPKDITDLLAGIRYATLSFSFMSFKDVPLISNLYDKFDEKQTNYFLVMLDIYYKSTLIYIMPLLLIIVFIMVIHCLVFTFSK